MITKGKGKRSNSQVTSIPEIVADEAIYRINVARHLLEYFEDPNELKDCDTGGYEQVVIREILEDVSDNLKAAMKHTRAKRETAGKAIAAREAFTMEKGGA